MKKLIIATLLSVGILTAGVSATASAKASYCGTSAYDTNYRKVYEYPTGTYWQKQIANAPKYYETNHAYFLQKYGC